MRSSKWMIIGYVLLFLSMVGLDQSTKFHAEKNYLQDYSKTDANSYYSQSTKVFTLGKSPSLLFENNLPSSEETGSWLDFNLTYVRNPGAAWGMFSGLKDPYRQWLFYCITAFACGLIYFLFKGSHPGQRMTRAGLVFVWAGAAGNFLDRVQLNYVIDFLHFHWTIFGWQYSFPVFNVADICINIGVGFVLVDMVLCDLALKNLSKLESSNDESMSKHPA